MHIMLDVRVCGGQIRLRKESTIFFVRKLSEMNVQTKKGYFDRDEWFRAVWNAPFYVMGNCSAANYFYLTCFMELRSMSSS